MTDSRSLFVHVARLFAAVSLVAVAACSAAPGEDAASARASEALGASSCGALKDLECTANDGQGEGPGGSNAGGKPSCSCVADTSAVDPNAPIKAVCSQTIAPVPGALAGLGCTRGVQFAFTTPSSDTLVYSATLWACPSGTSVTTPIFGGTLCDGTWLPCETVFTGPKIDNNCVGNALPGWTLVEDVMEDVAGPVACSGGCPKF